MAFETLLRHWTKHINLVSASDSLVLWDRHVKDSAQLFQLIPPDWRLWLDLGSGGGFPGIVIAIMAKDVHPSGQIALVESDARKATFLRTVIRELDLAAVVHAKRIADVAPQKADIISARALASLPALIELAIPHLTPLGTALFPKGRQVAGEIAAARRHWRFELTSVPSRTDPDATLLCLKGLARA